MEKVYIVSAKRTAIGSFLGGLKKLSPGELGGRVIADIIKENSLNGKEVDEVVIGNVLSAGQGQGVARQASIKGGLPVEVPAYSINMICGSGMKALMNGVNTIKSGEGDLVLVGGAESMSQAGFVVPASIRDGHKMMDMKLIDSMVNDGLTDAFEGYHMGITAENIVDKYNISREVQDKFAINSQKKAINAVDTNRFCDEIVPIQIKNRKETTIFERDEHPNRETSFDKLQSLRPAFKKDGSVTAGNSSGLNDGASLLLLASEKALSKYNLKPLVEVVAMGQGGVDPSVMGLGPVVAINNLLKKANIALNEVDLLELNEAFAAQALGVMMELSDQHQGVNLKWFEDKTNVNGGAIALGHPIGASGARIVTTLVHEMKKRNDRLGLASLCIGGGMGAAVLLKNTSN